MSLFGFVDGIARAAVHTALLPVRAVAEPVLSKKCHNPLDSITHSVDRIASALGDAEEELEDSVR